MKYIYIILTIFLLQGCFTQFFLLSTVPEPKKTYPKKDNLLIGVEEVKVPKYLFKNEIAVAKSSSQIEFLSSASWAEELDVGLTQRIKGYLQKKFNQPYVYSYPWDIDKEPTIKIKVQIAKFIAQLNFVHLDASWEITKVSTGEKKAELFSIKVPIEDSSSSIVDGMYKAFGSLEENLSQGVASFVGYKK